MSKSRIIWLILLVMASFGAVQAQPPTAPGLLVYNVWLRPTAPAPLDGAAPAAPIPGTVSGAYMTIENTGDTAYRLVGVDGGFAETSMLHRTTIDDKGVIAARLQCQEVAGTGLVDVNTGSVGRGICLHALG